MKTIFIAIVRKPKVYNFDLIHIILFSEHDIHWVQISVYNAFLVNITNSFQYLFNYPETLRFLEPFHVFFQLVV